MVRSNLERDEMVNLSDYDAAWPAMFESERARLAEALAPWLEGPVEHVGSTAVPGLMAKPIIDIMAGVLDLEASRPAIDALVKLDYYYSAYKPEVMHWFCRPHFSHRTHHLHLVPFESPLWHERLAFRDHLRRHADVADEYSALKRELARRFRNDREAYTRAKNPFVARVCAQELTLLRRRS